MSVKVVIPMVLMFSIKGSNVCWTLLKIPVDGVVTLVISLVIVSVTVAPVNGVGPRKPEAPVAVSTYVIGVASDGVPAETAPATPRASAGKNPVALRIDARSLVRVRFTNRCRAVIYTRVYS